MSNREEKKMLKAPSTYIIIWLVVMGVSILCVPKLQIYIHGKPAPQLVPIKERLEAIYFKEIGEPDNKDLLEAISENLDSKLEEYLRQSKSNRLYLFQLNIMFDTNDDKTLVKQMQKRGFRYIDERIAPYFILFELPEETPFPAQPLTQPSAR